MSQNFGSGDNINRSTITEHLFLKGFDNNNLEKSVAKKTNEISESSI